MTGDFKNRGEYPHLVVEAEMRQAIMKEEPMNLPSDLIWIPPVPPQITLRQYLAGCVVQGLVTGWAQEISLKRIESTFAEDSVRIGDALIKELERTDQEHKP